MDRWTYCLLVELHEAGDDAVILQSAHQVNDAGEGELSKNCGSVCVCVGGMHTNGINVQIVAHKMTMVSFLGPYLSLFNKSSGCFPTACSVLIYGAERRENEVSGSEVGCRHIYGIHGEELSAIRGSRSGTAEM